MQCLGHVVETSSLQDLHKLLFSCYIATAQTSWRVVCPLPAIRCCFVYAPSSLAIAIRTFPSRCGATKAKPTEPQSDTPLELRSRCTVYAINIKHSPIKLQCLLSIYSCQLLKSIPQPGPLRNSSSTLCCSGVFIAMNVQNFAGGKNTLKEPRTDIEVAQMMRGEVAAPEDAPSRVVLETQGS